MHKTIRLGLCPVFFGPDFTKTLVQFQGGSFYYDIAENPYATIQWHHHHNQQQQQQQQFHFGNPRLILPTRARGTQDGL